MGDKIDLAIVYISVEKKCHGGQVNDTTTELLLYYSSKSEIR